MLPHLQVAGTVGERGLIPSTDQYGTALADLVRCHNCGHIQLDRFPAEESLAESYAEASSQEYIEEEAGQRETARRILSRIEERARRGRLLDLGCWVGFLLAEAGDRGWSAIGVEPSEFAADWGRQNLGVEILSGEIATTAVEGPFETIFMGDVIEHLIDPGAALDRAHGLLTPGGVLALALPDAGSRLARMMGQRWWSVLPTHVQYFSRRSLALLLRAHGFEPVLAETAPKSFTLRYYLQRLAGYSPVTSRVLVRTAEITGLADRLWAPDFRDRMLVLAARRS